MNIVLVNLPAFTVSNNSNRFPSALGLLSIASLISLPDQVDLVSPKISSISYVKNPRKFYRKISHEILSHKPNLIGMTTRCDSFYHTVKIAMEIYKIAPQIPIILGGPQASICDIDILRTFPSITAIIRGEAEIAFPAYLSALKNRSFFENISNLTFRKEGKIIKTKDDVPIKNLDTIPMPMYSLLPKTVLKNPSFDIEVGRGCPYNCIFCSTNAFFHRYYRLKSPERIISELQYIQKLYPQKTVFSFQHDNLTAHKQMFLSLCKLLQTKKMHLTWRFSSRIDIVDTELLKIMKQAGCASIYFGIETGSPRMQKNIGKNLNLHNIRPTLAMCKKLGFHTTTSFIVGFPEETVEDVEQTLQLILDCLHYGATSIQLHLLSPLRGSSLYETWKNRLYYSNNFFSDMTGGATKNELQMIKKYPTLFSAYYRFPTPLISDYQFASMIAFGQVAAILPNTLYTFVKKYYYHSLYTFCSEIATVFEKKRIFDFTFSSPEEKSVFFIHLWIKELLKIIRKSSHSVLLEKIYNKELLQYAKSNLSIL